MLKNTFFKAIKVVQSELLIATLARFSAAYPPEMLFDVEVLNTNAW